jgi:hypothetical protein
MLDFSFSRAAKKVTIEGDDRASTDGYPIVSTPKTSSAEKGQGASVQVMCTQLLVLLDYILFW